MQLLFFKPIQRKAIWGHTAVKDYFHYDWFEEGVGQCWAFACQSKEGLSTMCVSEPFENQTLEQIWKEHPELFAFPQGDFPVIISLVGPEDDLSIQVHPDHEKAKLYGYEFGKNEAWYVIDTKSDDTSLVYGHTCKDRTQMESMIAQNQWKDIYKIRPTKKGDFIYLPAGILHAMGKNHIMYEIQQSTDVTFRFYDYERKDAKGNTRELHLQDALDCVSFDSQIDKQEIEPIVNVRGNLKETIFIQNDSFTVTKHDITGDCDYVCDNYQLASVVTGCGEADGKVVCVGDNFLIPANHLVRYNGNMTIMMTTKDKCKEDKKIIR